MDGAGRQADAAAAAAAAPHAAATAVLLLHLVLAPMQEQISLTPILLFCRHMARTQNVCPSYLAALHMEEAS